MNGIRIIAIAAFTSTIMLILGAASVMAADTPVPEEWVGSCAPTVSADQTDWSLDRGVVSAEGDGLHVYIPDGSDRATDVAAVMDCTTRFAMRALTWLDAAVDDCIANHGQIPGPFAECMQDVLFEFAHRYGGVPRKVMIARPDEIPLV